MGKFLMSSWVFFFLTSEDVTSCFDQPLQVFGLEKDI